ncbi:hypothetical protein HW555_008144, partial [Spodoptera exigua]
HKIQDRTQRILALVPVEHAPSDTSDKSDTNSDNELPPPSPSPVSSSAPSINSSLERLNINSSPEPETTQTEGELLETSDIFHVKPEASLQLTPVLHKICPDTPSREPNYDSVPSLSSMISSPMPGPSSTRIRKTRAQKDKKKGIFRHPAIIEETHEASVDFPDDAPLNYFYLFFSEDIFTDLVEQTNMYSVQQTGKSIQVSEDEMRDFISMHIMIGIVEMPCYLDYWSNKFRYGQIADICRFLHFNDTNLQDLDRYYKQKNENKFSVDEMMIPYKGRKAGNRKQYMKDEPNKWGFKNYVHAGVSVMIYDFILYAGEDTFRSYTFTEQESSLGFGAQIVIALARTIKKNQQLCYVTIFSHPQSSFIHRSARLTSPIRFDNIGHYPSIKEDMGRCKYCQKKYNCVLFIMQYETLFCYREKSPQLFFRFP